MTDEPILGYDIAAIIATYMASINSIDEIIYA